MAVPMKIKELPFSAIWELCRYLDNPNLLHHSGWRGLLSKAPGKIYNALDVSAFERVGQRPNGSPTEAVIQDFITRGFTVDDLYLMLTGIGHAEGKKALQEYVSPCLIETQEDSTQQRPSAEEPDPPSPSHDVHPQWGPLPDDPPPIVPRGPYVNPKQRGSASTSNSPNSSSMHTTVPAGHNGAGVVGMTENNAKIQAGKIQNGTKTKTDPGWCGMELGNSQVTGMEGPYNQNGAQLLNGAGKAMDSTTTSHTSYRYAPFSTPSVPTDLSRHSYSQEPTQAQSTAGALCHPQAPGSDHTNLPEMNYKVPPSATQYPVTARAEQASLGRQETVTLPQAYPPRLPNMAYSRPLTSTSTTSSQYSSDSTYSGRVPHTLHQDTSSYTSSNLSDHSLLPGQIRPPAWADSPASSTVSTSSIDLLMLTLNILSFSFTELSEATGDFTQDIVGIGTFGTVFKAKIRGNGPYAIKKLHNESEMEGGMFYGTFHQETFTQELQLLTKYHHRNILSLVAYSNDGPRPCLVYEYMENGSLAECLLGKRRVSLPWSVRLEIANQVADALHFLHTVNQPKCLLVHGDVKSANILLDTHLVPKLSDFGLARECHRKPSQKSTYSMQSRVVGTMAYMAPEFIRNRKLTPKMDVYSFGVVLLELYTGLAADDPTLEEKRILTQRLVHLFENTNEREVASLADVRAEWPQDVGFDLFVIATVCLRKKAKDRPHMDQVRAQLGHSSPELDLSQHQICDPPAYSMTNHHPGDDMGGRHRRWQ